MRALDMIQCNLRENAETANFSAVNCGWNGNDRAVEVRHRYFRIPSTFLGISGGDDL